ncbi:MAG: RNA 2',3'-cyclic phosphodiesterase [Chloroflexi bacterium]|nr:RNA 2',3'-cyclic phosphodiesterase [Chloroflexota bacterium]
MPETERLFIAIDLPADVRDGLARIQLALKKQSPPETVRWVNPNGIHLTLKFLGDVPVTQRATIEEKLVSAAQPHGVFSLVAGGLGCFPNALKPRVVWVGVHQSLEPLIALRDAIERAIAPLGYPTEDRAFSPHLTLGRVRQEARRADSQQLGEVVAQTSVKEKFEWHVSDVCLIRSDLKPSGAIYTTLFHAPLKLEG